MDISVFLRRQWAVVRNHLANLSSPWDEAFTGGRSLCRAERQTLADRLVGVATFYALDLHYKVSATRER